MPTVLYLAHGFPPASGSGAVRSLAFARYLPMYGWRALVLTPGERWASNADARLAAQVPGGLEVIRTGSLEPRPSATANLEGRRQAGVSWDGLARRVRRHGGHLRRFPDAHLGWLPFGVGAGLRLAPRVDVLYSSSGPFTSHLVGLVLHVLTGRPWVAELRDGWYRWNRSIFPDYPGWRAPVEAWLEGQVIRRATRVVCVTERMAEAFRCQYADLAPEHFAVVPNGFDPAAQAERHGPAGGFAVVHAGALYYGRSIRPFLDAAARLMHEDARFGEQFRLELVGSLDQTARAEVDTSAVAGRVVCHGQVDHPSTLARERAADLLLLVANTTPGAQATVPGKLFEYLASGRPVLAIAPSESATADVLSRTGGGWLADGSDAEAVYAQLRAAFRREPISVEPEELARFDRRRLAGELARVLESALLG